jgi:protein SCO1/2
MKNNPEDAFLVHESKTLEHGRMAKVASPLARERGTVRVITREKFAEPLTLILSPSAKGRGEPRTGRRLLRIRAGRMALMLVLSYALVRPAYALTPGDLSRVTLEQHPGRQLSRDLVFRDENDQPFRFGNQTVKQPMIVVPGYYRCPMLCSLINDGLIQALQELRMSAARDFQVVDLSVDPKETPADALRKKSEYVRRYGRAGAAEGWHCLVGDERAIAKVTDELGFHYVYDPETKEYAHPSGVIVLTPEGRISRYIFGATFEARELRDALVAAKGGESTSTVSKLFLLCYHYNPITGKYGALIMWIVRAGGIATVAGIGCSILYFARRTRSA